MRKARSIRPPRFESDIEFDARRSDTEFWRPYVEAVLERIGRGGDERYLTIGTSASWPVFLHGDIAVKLFGQREDWRAAFRSERAAHVVLAADPGIAAPGLVAEGRLFLGNETSWPYLVTTRLPGVDWREAEPDPDQRTVLARELGRQIRRLHAIRAWGEVATSADRPVRNVREAALRSSLPLHLAEQASDFVARMGIHNRPEDRVFRHGGLSPRHILVENGHLSGLLDWGGAMVDDRHSELPRLLLDTFLGDKILLRLFLEAARWPVGRDFPRRALAHTLARQADARSRHGFSDLFLVPARRYPLEDMQTLDELAVAVFGI